MFFYARITTMSRQEKRTILLNTIFNFCASLVSTFISVYLYIYTNSIPMMCLYIIIRIGCFPIFFTLGTKLVKKYPFTLTYTIGLSLITCALIYALAGTQLFETNPYYVLIAAAIVGTGEGFYYFSANTCNQIISTPQTRAKFYVYNSVFNTIGSLFAPMFATLVLNSVEDEMFGYRILLYVIVVVFIIVIFVALKINARSKDVNSSVRKSLKLTGDQKWLDHNIAVFCYGLRDGLGLNTINLLVYQAAGNGGTYSKVQTLFSFVGILAYYSTKRLLNKEYISNTMQMGVIFRVISTLILLYIPNMMGAITYGLINTLAAAFYDNAYNYLSAQIIGSYKEEMTARVVAKETYLSFGRITSMLIVLICYKLLSEQYYLLVSVTILSFAPIVVERLLVKHK